MTEEQKARKREWRRLFHLRHKERRNAEARARRRANPEKDKAYGLAYRRKYAWKALLQHAKKRAAKFGWAYDLDQHTDELIARLGKMKCELTGVPLVNGAGAGSGGKRYWNTASLDRIDRNKGYTYDNVRLVCWAMNCAMGTWGETILRDVMTRWLDKSP